MLIDLCLWVFGNVLQEEFAGEGAYVCKLICSETNLIPVIQGVLNEKEIPSSILKQCAWVLLCITKNNYSPDRYLPEIITCAKALLTASGNNNTLLNDSLQLLTKLLDTPSDE